MSRGRPAHSRQTRLPLVVAALFAAIVLLTGIPVSTLLTQHRQLSTTAAQLHQLQTADQALSYEARRLTDPAVVAGLARTEYGLVAPGHKAYVILPPSGASASVVAGSGHVPLQGPPVTPGSAQSEALLGVTGSSPRPAAGPRAGHRARAASAKPSTFLTRVLHTLEFWR
ncbi:MAG TPA: septum formation initiator family protein [Acidimicrobiales bacterium]|nr:septum formation initiator family protein [Acidimicrobiales bacterium]